MLDVIGAEKDDDVQDTMTDQNQASTADPGVGSGETHKCGMCCLMVGDDGIGCDRCSTWFHPSEMCLGFLKIPST